MGCSVMKASTNKIIIVIIIATLLSLSVSNASILGSLQEPDDNLEMYFPFEMLVVQDRDLLDMANEVMNDNMVVNTSFKNAEAYYNIKNIDWDMMISDSPTTYSLFLHGLNPVFFLIYAYNRNNNNDYLDRATEIIKSWTDYSNQENINVYAWNDHAVALRLTNLLYYTAVLKSKNIKIPLEIMDVIKTDTEWLNNDENYTFKHNHGVSQDIALIKGSVLLENADYLNHAIERLNTQLAYAFPNKYIHIENTPAYRSRNAVCRK